MISHAIARSALPRDHPSTSQSAKPKRLGIYGQWNSADSPSVQRPSQLKEIEISLSGFGIHFRAVDADLYVPGLLEGFLGSKAWMASWLGQRGGRSKSRAKKAAAKANGSLGGRPRKAIER